MVAKNVLVDDKIRASVNLLGVICKVSNSPSVRFYHLNFVLWATYFLRAADWPTTNFLMLLVKSV